MAEFYCDHGAYGLASNRLGLDNPATWAVPQEGDGSATTPAAASSVASIKFNAVPTTGSFTICGLSPATTGVLSAASTAAAATALAANINAVSSTVSALVAVGQPQLRNLVFARVNPGDSSMVQIMMRVGSATLNHANNSNVAISHSFNGTAPTVVQFAGGSGGCWGWFCNIVALGVGGSIAVNNYGVAGWTMPAVAASNLAPLVSAAPTSADFLYVRTGAGQTIDYPLNTMPRIGSATFGSQIVIDTNTRWTGDTGLGTITLRLSIQNHSGQLRLAPDNGGVSSLRCIRRGALVMRYESLTGSGEIFLNGASITGNRFATQITGVKFQTNPSLPSGAFWCFTLQGGYLYTGFRFKDCDWELNHPVTSWPGWASIAGIEGALLFEGCTLSVNLTSATTPASVLNVGLSGIGSQVRLTSCHVSGWPFGKFNAVTIAGGQFTNGGEIVIEGCTGIQLNSYTGCSASDLNTGYGASYTYISAEPGLGFRHENRAGVVDWNPDASPPYPTRSARLLDNATPWSLKFDWFSSTFTPVSHLVSPRLATVNRLADGVRSAQIDLLAPVALDSNRVALRVHYIDTNGRARSDSTEGRTGVITTPAPSWTGAGAFPGHSPYRITLPATSFPVKSGTEIACYLEFFGNSPTGSAIQVYADPEVLIS